MDAEKILEKIRKYIPEMYRPVDGFTTNVYYCLEKDWLVGYAVEQYDTYRRTIKKIRSLKDLTVPALIHFLKHNVITEDELLYILRDIKKLARVDYNYKEHIIDYDGEKLKVFEEWTDEGYVYRIDY